MKILFAGLIVAALGATAAAREILAHLLNATLDNRTKLVSVRRSCFTP